MSLASVFRAAMPRRALVPLALVAFPATLAAQHIVGADINAAAESETRRGPLYFAGAGLPARGLGLSLHAVGTRQELVRPTGGGARLDVFTTTASAWWGATSWLAIGAYYAKANADELPIDEPLAPMPSTGGLEPDGPPTRQGTRVPLGSDEAGLHGRLALWRSATGDTRVTALGRLLDRVDLPVTSTAGVALEHRLARATLHLAPSAWFGDGASTTLELNAGAAFAVGARSALNAEVLHIRGTDDVDGVTPRVTELAGGLRHRLGRLAVDVGARHLVDYSLGADGQSRTSAMLATHWRF